MKRILIFLAVLTLIPSVAQATGRQRFVQRQVVRQKVVTQQVRFVQPRRQVIRQRVVVQQQYAVPQVVQQFVVPSYSVRNLLFRTQCNSLPQKVRVQQFKSHGGCAAMLGY